MNTLLWLLVIVGVKDAVGWYREDWYNYWYGTIVGIWAGICLIV